MNQRGDITLLSCLLILAFSSLVLLCSLKLRKSFKLLQKRTELFLCVKETKGEIHQFLTFMGRTNWAIKNTNRASLIMAFIPGFQGAALEAQKVKKYLKYVQEGRFISYLKTLNSLKERGCPLDPKIYISPLKLGGKPFKRDGEGAAILREPKWTYYFFSKPYLLSLKMNAQGFERINPVIVFSAKEKVGRLSSLYSSH